MRAAALRVPSPAAATTSTGASSSAATSARVARRVVAQPHQQAARALDEDEVVVGGEQGGGARRGGGVQGGPAGAAGGGGGGERVGVAGQLGDGGGRGEPSDVGEVARLARRDAGLRRLEHRDPARVQGGDRGRDDRLADPRPGPGDDEDPAVIAVRGRPRAVATTRPHRSRRSPGRPGPVIRVTVAPRSLRRPSATPTAITGSAPAPGRRPARPAPARGPRRSGPRGPSGAAGSCRPVPTAAGSSRPAPRGRRHRRAAATATSGSPRTTGTTADGGAATPAASASAAACRSTATGRSGSARRTSSAASAAPTAAGARPVSKMNDRAVSTRCAVTAAGPSTAPPCAPSAFDSVTVATTSSAPASPTSASSPRPPGPRTPSPCASSTTSSAPRARHTACSACSGAVVAVGAVDALDHHQRPLLGPTRERGVHRADVPARHHRDPRPGQPAGVDDRRVVGRVGDHQRAGAGERGDGPEVGRVPGGEDEPVREPAERRERAVQRDVQRRRPGDEPRAGGPRPPGAERRDRALDHPGVARQAQVVVAGEVEHGLGGGPRRQLAAQPGGPPAGRVGVEPGEGVRGQRWHTRTIGGQDQPAAAAAHTPSTIAARSAAVHTYGGIV